MGYLKNMLLYCQLKLHHSNVAIKSVSLKLFLKNKEEEMQLICYLLIM